MAQKSSLQEALEILMKEKNYKQIDVVKKIGWTKTRLSRLLSGERKPELEKLKIVCSAINVELGHYFMKVAELEYSKNSDDNTFRKIHKSLKEVELLMNEQSTKIKEFA